MKMEWLITNILAADCPIRVESEVFWAIFDVFWPSWAAFVVGESLCDLETPCQAKKMYDHLMKLEQLIGVRFLGLNLNRS